MHSSVRRYTASFSLSPSLLFLCLALAAALAVGRRPGCGRTRNQHKRVD